MGRFSISNCSGCASRLRRAALLLYALCCSAAGESALFEIDSAQIASTLDHYFQQAQQALADHDIRLARQQLSLVSFKVEKYASSIGKNEKKTYDARLLELKTSVKRVVDSLVRVNLFIIKNHGQSAGIEFRRQCSSAGLSEAELAPVDEAIVNAGSVEEQPQPQSASQQAAVAVPVRQPPRPQGVDSAAIKKDTAPGEKSFAAPPVAPSPEPVAPAAQPSAVSTGEMPPARQQSAPQAPPQKPETARSEGLAFNAAETAQKGKSIAASNASKIYALINERNYEEAMTVFNLYQPNLRQFLSPQDFEQLRSMVETAYSQDQNRKSRARQIAQTIDDLVDQDRSAEAFALLREKRGDLKSSLDKDEVNRLETKVGKAYVEFGKAQGAANAKARDIRALIADRNVEEAAVLFEKARTELQRCLPKDSFEQLRRDVEGAIGEMKDQKKFAAVCVRDIRSLIDEGKGLAAASKFIENKPLLQRTMDEKTFSAVSQEVAKAKTDFFIRQAKAQSDLTRIDSLIAAKRIDAAYAAFEKGNNDLRKDCADDKRFFDCKDRVMKAYDDMKAQRKKALRSAKNIEGLVKHQKGLDAHIAFQLDASVLREVLEPQQFKKLEEAVRKSYMDWESNVAAARLMAQDIEGLLAKRQVEPAYEAFKKAEDVFDRFLDNDKAIDDLEKKVKQSYGQYQKKKRWASSFIRELQWLMDHKRANQASAQLTKARPELSTCVEPQQLIALDSSVAQANRRYVADKATAEKNAGRVRALIDQKRFEEAYGLFKGLREDLETYLSENAFTNLRNETTNAYEEYEDKKKKAERYAKQLKFLVERKKMEEAKSGFLSNRAALKLYLSEQDFRGLEKKVMGASAAVKPAARK